MQTPKGWSIPIPVLIQMGLMDRTTSPDPVIAPDSSQMPHQEAPTTAPTQTHLEPLVEALREKLAEAEKRAAVAEAVAAERERIIEVQAQALRMIEAPRTAREKSVTLHIEDEPAEAAPALHQEPAAVAEETPKRRWWKR
ncbi:MAG TPA: hypothetical protein VHS28_03750 [Chloroflexota bacterium]|nr:hypothetical protein [Chloroflexota bacterium]